MEQELKMFFTDREKYRSLMLSLKLQTLHIVNMSAVYYDTPEGALRQKGITFRVRQEGGQIISTIKTRGEAKNGVFLRNEWNVELSDEAPAPEKFLTGKVESGDPDEALQAIIGEITAETETRPLVEVCRADFIRQRGVVSQFGAEMELSIDNGCLSAGGRMAPIWELELEMISGDARALSRMREILQTKYGMLPGGESKYGRCLAMLDGR